MSHEEKVESLFEMLNSLEEENAKKLFQTFTDKQKKKFVQEYISSVLFSSIDELSDGRLEILDCNPDTDEQVFVFPDGKRYRLKLELTD